MPYVPYNVQIKLYFYVVPAKKPPDPNEKPQKERFIDAAKKAEADPDAFDRAMKRILPAPKKPKR